jgi:hypothetical protein
MAIEKGFNTKGFDKLKKTLKKLQGLDVQVGWIKGYGDKKYPDGQTVASIALFMEFGTDFIPPRGSLRRTFESKKAEINKIWEKELKKIFAFKQDPVMGYAEIGKQIAKLVLKTLENADSWAASLDPKTVERKGSKTPLVDSGLLKENISWAVTRDGAIIKSGKVS